MSTSQPQPAITVLSLLARSSLLQLSLQQIGNSYGRQHRSPPCIPIINYFGSWVVLISLPLLRLPRLWPVSIRGSLPLGIEYLHIPYVHQISHPHIHFYLEGLAQSANANSLQGFHFLGTLLAPVSHSSQPSLISGSNPRPGSSAACVVLLPIYLTWYPKTQPPSSPDPDLDLDLDVFVTRPSTKLSHVKTSHSTNDEFPELTTLPFFDACDRSPRHDFYHSLIRPSIGFTPLASPGKSG
ncbi:hypothetical protein SODALDRAFT_355032 [Sodiomyces alkalinus F11]|uniref:Uncharacterized protein n=1 Tax=Sodiomyces alkalinus (strain CBS 110278 / VKM F-3762 / F11) TaxID=1314773 RepID=A0A3N2Q7U3_SODAK|nr:hypothetical protein SODALDRAFT_355032 [Sodiomyces alkalinus F11]ROT42843.1 hypothetical protein SODALDRAFT_355032 [Sodiomyces alkalinus F11]